MLHSQSLAIGRVRKRAARCLVALLPTLEVMGRHSRGVPQIVFGERPVFLGF